MKDGFVGNKRNKFSLKSAILLGSLALAVVVVLGTAVHAAVDGTAKIAATALYTQTARFNPFTLSTSTLSTTINLTEGNSGAITLEEPIRIAVRPPKRSPGKPWWVPGPPPWHKIK